MADHQYDCTQCVCTRCYKNTAVPGSDYCLVCNNDRDLQMSSWVDSVLGQSAIVSTASGVGSIVSLPPTTQGTSAVAPDHYSPKITPVISEMAYPVANRRAPQRSWVTATVLPCEGLTVIIWGILAGESEPDSHAGYYANKQWWSIKTKDGDLIPIHKPTHWMYMPSAPGEFDEVEMVDDVELSVANEKLNKASSPAYISRRLKIKDDDSSIINYPDSDNTSYITNNNISHINNTSYITSKYTDREKCPF